MLLKKYSISLLARKFREEKDVRVRERLQMMLYLREGKVQRDVSRLLKVSIGIVPYWKKRFEEEGIKGLNDKPGRGRKAKLQKKNLALLEEAISKGVLMPDGYVRGYKTKDVNEFIQKKFGVSYTNRHCIRLLRRLKYNLKIPRPRNKSRNQEDVKAFKNAFKKNERVWEKNTQSSHMTKHDSLSMLM